jgi:hypothetical protein
MIPKRFLVIFDHFRFIFDAAVEPFRLLFRLLAFRLLAFRHLAFRLLAFRLLAFRAG